MYRLFGVTVYDTNPYPRPVVSDPMVRAKYAFSESVGMIGLIDLPAVPATTNTVPAPFVYVPGEPAPEAHSGMKSVRRAHVSCLLRWYVCELPWRTRSTRLSISRSVRS